MNEIFGFDAYAPKEIAERVETIGVTKARLPLLSQATLGVLAGGFIGLGALYFTFITADSSLGFALSRMLGGIAFSLGLILVVLAGAELFTGNNFMVMAWASRRISSWELMRNWLIIYSANFIGALGLAVLVFLSNHPETGAGSVGENAVKIAYAKASLLLRRSSREYCVTSWCVSPSGWRSPAGALSIRFLPSCFRSPRLSPQASSTASQICILFLSEFYYGRPLTWRMQRC
jgi:hypothetical protein